MSQRHNMILVFTYKATTSFQSNALWVSISNYKIKKGIKLPFPPSIIYFDNIQLNKYNQFNN